MSNETDMAGIGLQTQTLGESDDWSMLAAIFQIEYWQLNYIKESWQVMTLSNQSKSFIDFE